MTANVKEFALIGEWIVTSEGLNSKCVARVPAGSEELAALLVERANAEPGLRAFKGSVDEALNTGNGSYRP